MRSVGILDRTKGGTRAHVKPLGRHSSVLRAFWETVVHRRWKGRFWCKCCGGRKTAVTLLSKRWCHQVTDCDCTTLTAVIGWGQSLAQSVSCLDSCRTCVLGLEVKRAFGLGTGLCFGDCWQWLWAPIPTAITCISQAYLAQAAGAPQSACKAAEVSWVGTHPPWWQWGGKLPQPDPVRVWMLYVSRTQPLAKAILWN